VFLPNNGMKVDLNMLPQWHTWLPHCSCAYGATAETNSWYFIQHRYILCNMYI